MFSKITLNIGKPIDITPYVSEDKIDPRKVISLTQKIQEEVISLRDNI